ncbi:uncharacterized protein LOC126670784 [Mercurialis annua]|uniref:uncharacterized protein LOC126670784 n=1 Tax=Mercurialis annua TaxID=3986 RepID=UPI00215FA9F5|nr:uncharacterized protein LOC126670784 [Mercurialis annua]XP_050220567.1 uncharacterized protein LOC126670784 [Mercurialis annua]
MERSFQDGDILKFLEDRIQFHNELKHTIWNIDGQYIEDRGDGIDVTGTGFCVHPHGYILTCSHCAADMIQVANFQTSVVHPAKIVGRSHKHDLALLLCELESDVIPCFDYVKFPDERDQLFVGEEVHSIGHPSSLIGSLMSGMIVYPCSEDYLCRTLENVQLTLLYPTLNPKMPIIQISNYFATAGASGSPIFDNTGCVVGMLIALHKHHNLGVHFKILSQFIKENLHGSEGSQKRRGRKWRKRN